MPLILALHGHPDAGGFWELHCEKALMSVGFERAAPEWKSVFRHPALDLLLVIYVDDFKLAGPKINLAQGWKLIGSKIKMELPQPIGRFLGCQQSIGLTKMTQWYNPRYAWTKVNPPKKVAPIIFSEFEVNPPKQTTQVDVQIMKYDMSSFLEQCVERYVELAGDKIVDKIKRVTTPFLDESKAEFDENDLIAKIKAARQPISDEVSSKAKYHAALSQGGGTLANIASAVLMKILYAARMGRFDLLRPVTALGSRITTWTKLCDMRLHRLVCYIKSTLNLKMYGWIGDKKKDLELVLYCDADLAGDRNDAKSTSGVFMCLVGPTSFMPLAAVSKKQTSVSKSTPEAEIVAIDHGLAKHAIPALSLWENILGKEMIIRLMEDNSAACRIVITGRNPSMRRMSRTQRIDVAWLNERFVEKCFMFVECPTEYQAGDLMTKHFTDVKVWERNLALVGHFDDHVFEAAFAKKACSAPLILLDEHCDVIETTDEAPAAAAASNSIPTRFTPYVFTHTNAEYVMILFCSYKDSLLNKPRNHRNMCNVVVIDERIDARSHKTKELIRLIVNMYKSRVFVWSSIPCTGGCTWNYINGKTPEGLKRIKAHIAVMIELLSVFRWIGKLVRQNNGMIGFEWPRKCTYWKRPDVVTMISELGLTRADFDGCAFGLRSSSSDRENMFIKKPWTVYSNCEPILTELPKHVCPGTSSDHEHDQCRGGNAKNSERYTDAMCLCIHKCCRAHFRC